MSPLLAAAALFFQDGSGQRATTLTLARTQKIIEEVDFDGVDAQKAIRSVLRQGVFGGTIAPDVRGTVTLRLERVPWEVAFQSVLRQVDATYRIDHGFFEIVRREPKPIEPTFVAGDLERMGEDARQFEAAYAWLREKIRSGQGKAIENRFPRFTNLDQKSNARASGPAAMRNLIDGERANPQFRIIGYRGGLTKERRPNVRSVGVAVAYAPKPEGPWTSYQDLWQREGTSAWRLVYRRDTQLRFKEAPLQTVTDTLSDQVGALILVDGKLAEKPLTIDLTGVPFDVALRQITESLDATYSIEGGAYRIVQRETPTP